MRLSPVEAAPLQPPGGVPTARPPIAAAEAAAGKELLFLQGFDALFGRSDHVSHVRTLLPG